MSQGISDMVKLIKKQKETTQGNSLSGEAGVMCQWELGFNDLFRGHRSYREFGIITKSGELILENISMELAEHIIEIHNKCLAKKGT